MHSTIAFTSLFLALVAAQTTEVPLFLPGLDPQPLVASVIGSDSTATTYAVSCSAGTDSDECGIPGTLTLTEGPSTVAYSLDLDPQTILIGCQLTGTTAAFCTATQSGVSVSAASDSVIATSLQASEIVFQQVTITAGAGAVASASASATATGSSASASASAASASAAASGASATASSGSTSASATAASTSSASGLVTAVQSNSRSVTATAATNSVSSSLSTAGMPRITGQAGYVLCGAFAAAGLVLGGL